MPPPSLQDFSLILTLALANGAATVTAATAIDTGRRDTAAYQPDQVEYLLSAPALTTAQLPDAATMKYDILASDNANLSSPTVIFAGLIIQTGAGGAGAAAASYQFRLPSGGAAYVFFRAANSGAGNASAASATLAVVV